MEYGVCDMVESVRDPGTGAGADAPCRIDCGSCQLVQDPAVRATSTGTRVLVRSRESHVGSNGRSEMPHGVRYTMRRSKWDTGLRTGPTVSDVVEDGSHDVLRTRNR